jgi:DNA-binding protein HU-beta
VNKAELIKELESRLGSRKAASDALTAVVDVIIREVAKGGSVAITGFGTFEQAARAARTGRNPRTGASVKIKKTVVPKFRAGSAFKDVVKNPRSLPKAAVAGARAAAGTATKVAASGARKAAPAKKASANKYTASKSAAGRAHATKKSAPAKKA